MPIPGKLAVGFCDLHLSKALQRLSRMGWTHVESYTLWSGSLTRPQQAWLLKLLPLEAVVMSVHQRGPPCAEPERSSLEMYLPSFGKTALRKLSVLLASTFCVLAMGMSGS